MSYLHTPELLDRVRYKLMNTRGEHWFFSVVVPKVWSMDPSDHFRTSVTSHYFHNDTNILLAIFNVLKPVLMIQTNGGVL